jgi:hypothetical protein
MRSSSLPSVRLSSIESIGPKLNTEPKIPHPFPVSAEGRNLAAQWGSVLCRQNGRTTRPYAEMSLRSNASPCSSSAIDVDSHGWCA